MALANGLMTQQASYNATDELNTLANANYTDEINMASSHLLIVDDEENLRTMYVDILSEFGYDVTGVADAEEALAMLNSKHFSLVITDMRLPGMSGTDLYESACLENPELSGRFVFASGDSHTQFLQDYAQHTGNRCLEKPFSLVQLLSTVREMLGVFAPSLT